MSSGTNHMTWPQMACFCAAFMFVVFALAQLLQSPQYGSFGVLIVDAVVLGTMSVFFWQGNLFCVRSLSGVPWS